MTIAVAHESYVTVAEADAYLAKSIRAATLWAAASTTTKEAALVSAFRLLEKQTYQGTNAGLTSLATIAINAAGTGYVVDDELTLTTDGSGVVAGFIVTSIGGSGEITGIAFTHRGWYGTAPASLTGAALSGGTGSGATVDLTTQSQTTMWPRTGAVDRYGTALTATDIPQQLKDAQFELAYELSQDSALETGSNADDNTKRVKAGSVEVEKFRIVEGGRFPKVIQELLRDLIGNGSGGGSAGNSYGTDGCSSFDDTDEYKLSGGF